MLRGGIERYVRTFPEGGFWKARGSCFKEPKQAVLLLCQGKNFLFDKRQEQVPENKPKEETEKEVGDVLLLSANRSIAVASIL